MSLRRFLNDTLVISVLRERFHAARADLFVSLMQPARKSTILDLGGSSGDFLMRIRDHGFEGQWVVADIDVAGESAAVGRGFSFVRLDESGALPFTDGQFDIVVCNSVIEHVTLPKKLCRAATREPEWRAASWQRQKEFAAEIRRVARGYFVQSPHKDFPVEQHTLLPGVNWLSHENTLRVLKFTDRFWFRRGVGVDWHLLDQTQMKALFPDANVHVERVLGIPKSVICFRKE